MIVRLYGDWQSTTAPAEYSERGLMLKRWLEGEAIDATPEAVADLRTEYLVLLDAHQATIARLMQHAEWCSTQGSAHVTSLELPAGPSQAWDAGYRAGAYHAYTTAAQQVRAAMSEVAAGAAEGGSDAKG